MAGGDHRRGDHLPPAPASGAHPAGAGAGGRHGLHLPGKDPSGGAFHLPPASGSPAPVPHRPAVCAAGRGAGPRQRRHHPADAGRLRRRRPAAHRRLRRPLRLEGGALVHGGRVPPPHLFRRTGGTGGPAAPQRPAPVRGRPAGGHRGRPAGGLHPLHAGHRQRGPWPEPGGAGPVRSNHPHPHVGPLRISECSQCRSGAAEGKLAKRRYLTWLL